MADNIPDDLDDLLNFIRDEDEDEEDEIPEGLDDLLESLKGDIKEEVKEEIQKEEGGGGGVLALRPKVQETGDDQLMGDETIDQRILDLLGLQDAMDLDYGEYKSLLRAKMAEGRMPNASMPTEDIELVTNEFKRIKSKTGQFRIKAKVEPTRITADIIRKRSPIASLSQVMRPPGRELPESVETETDEELDGISENLSDLDDLLREVRDDFARDLEERKEEDKIEDQQRLQEQRDKKEEEAEKRPTPVSLPKVSLPNIPIPFFDRIKKFFGNILAGSVLLGLFKWINDEENRKKLIEVKDWVIDKMPLIVAAIAGFVAINLGLKLIGFLGKLLGIIKTLTGVARTLFNLVPGSTFIAKVLAPAVALFILPKIYEMIDPKAFDRNTRKAAEEAIKAGKSKEELIKDLRKQKESIKGLDLQGKRPEIDKIIRTLEGTLIFEKLQDEYNRTNNIDSRSNLEKALGATGEFVGGMFKFYGSVALDSLGALYDDRENGVLSEGTKRNRERMKQIVDFYSPIFSNVKNVFTPGSKVEDTKEEEEKPDNTKSDATITIDNSKEEISNITEQQTKMTNMDEKSTFQIANNSISMDIKPPVKGREPSIISLTGGGSGGPTSAATPSQKKVPTFSSYNPNDFRLPATASIYNLV